MKIKAANTHKKRTALIAIAAVIAVDILLPICILLGVFLYHNIQAEKEAKKVYPLGDSSKLEFVGQVGYGCWLICDSNPASIYYYATDMSVDDTIIYFKKVTTIKQPSRIDNEITFDIKTLSGETLYPSYFIDKQPEYDSHPYFKRTNKQHLLSIPSFKYGVLKDSL